MAEDTRPDPNRQHSPPQSLFVPAPTGFKLPYTCSEVAMLPNGHLLLAAGEYGLVECKANGMEVSRWRKTNRKGVLEVHTIAVLSERRVAVGLKLKKMIVLLQQPAADDHSGTWQTLEKFPDLLRASPWRMAVHNNLIGVAEWSTGGALTCSQHLTVLSVNAYNSLKVDYYRQRKYKIYSLAITSNMVITSSNCAVKLENGLRAVVVEAYTYGDDILLWKHEADVGEIVHDIVVIVSKEVLLMVKKGTEDSGKVAAIRLTNGSPLPEDVAVVQSQNSRIKNPLKPLKLTAALVDGRTVLAVLEDDGGVIVCQETAMLQNLKCD